jgi:ceramide glucosyltransferase
MHRWFLFALLLLRDQSPAWTLTITLLHGLPPLLLWTLLITVLITAPASIASATCLLCVLPIRAATLIAVQRTLTGRSRHSPVLSILSELFQPLHLLHALVTRRIVWRTRRYLVRANDDFTAA